MNTILKNIINKIIDVEGPRFEDFSPASFQPAKRAEPIDIIPPMDREFFVIAETKKGSPSKGIIREDYSPAGIAADYQEAGASAISVITEENFFYGSKTHLPQVKAQVDLPVLRKDFLVHPFQVYESYNMGADFILLIAACLTDEKLRELYRLAETLGMRVLVEVHTHEELNRAIKLEPKIIGINNRNLKTFEVDLSTSFRLKRKIPQGIHVISESGIRAPSDIKALREAGFSGALIGESLLRQQDTAIALKKIITERKRQKPCKQIKGV
jgi:indole-3-glycerol phosphate synthase